MITDQEGNKKLIPIMDSTIHQQPRESELQQISDNTKSQTSSQISALKLPQKSGSLSIIFRKVTIVLVTSIF